MADKVVKAGANSSEKGIFNKYKHYSSSYDDFSDHLCALSLVFPCETGIANRYRMQSSKTALRVEFLYARLGPICHAT